jgi:hypothetical protein
MRKGKLIIRSIFYEVREQLQAENLTVCGGMYACKTASVYAAIYGLGLRRASAYLCNERVNLEARVTYR